MTARKASTKATKQATAQVLLAKLLPAKKPKKENKLFPGRPNYTGPRGGYFAMLHHEVLFEKAAFSGVDERVSYVRQCKPRKEQKVRLYNMMYVGDCPIIAALDRCGRSDALSDGTVRHELAPLVLAYIRTHMPDHSWVRCGGRGKIKGT